MKIRTQRTKSSFSIQNSCSIKRLSLENLIVEIKLTVTEEKKLYVLMNPNEKLFMQSLVFWKSYPRITTNDFLEEFSTTNAISSIEILM